MEKSIVQYSSSSSSTSIRYFGGRITRSMAKCAREPEAAVVGGNSNGSSLKNAHSSPAYTNQVKKKSRRKNALHLPEEILFKIFLLLPAKVLHGVMRAVCRSWRKVIRDPVFIKAHLIQSLITPFYLDKSINFDQHFKLYFLDADQTTWKFNKNKVGLVGQKIKRVYLSHGDGLLLTENSKDDRLLSIINPLTKQIVKLPRLPYEDLLFNVLFPPHIFAIACSISTLDCKVVFTYRRRTYILTVGVDKEWRAILVESTTTLMPLYKLSYVQGIWGFIYWYSLNNVEYLIALDVETEVFYKVLFPKECKRKMLFHASSDRLLSFVFSPRFGSRFGRRNNMLVNFEFWELVDCKDGGKWRKIGSVDWEGKRYELNVIMGLNNISVVPGSEKFWNEAKIYPVAILKCSDVAIFHFLEPNDVYISYNFKTGKCFRWLDSSREFDMVNFRHVDSLVVLKTYCPGSFEEEKGESRCEMDHIIYQSPLV